MYGLGLDPGTYYAVVKAYNPTDFTVNLATFPPVTVTSVSGNDTCANAFAIPPGRALFQGDTTALHDDYSSPCAGATPGNDAVFSLHLAARSRLTLTTDTTFFHSVWVTQQDRCPGTTPSSTGNTCTFGNHSTLDATLAAGDYYIYVDSPSGAGGPYSMLVDITPTM
jgi:hypothetical protein